MKNNTTPQAGPQPKSGGDDDELTRELMNLDVSKPQPTPRSTSTNVPTPNQFNQPHASFPLHPQQPNHGFAPQHPNQQDFGWQQPQQQFNVSYGQQQFGHQSILPSQQGVPTDQLHHNPHLTPAGAG